MFCLWFGQISSVAFFTYLLLMGLLKKKWTTTLLGISTLILITFLGLKIHASSGGIYETKTIGAMIFRISCNPCICNHCIFHNNKRNYEKITILIPVISLFFSVVAILLTKNQKSKPETVTHEEHQHNAEIQNIELNNGEKWKLMLI